jgi:hypothetical protein
MDWLVVGVPLHVPVPLAVEAVVMATPLIPLWLVVKFVQVPPSGVGPMAPPPLPPLQPLTAAPMTGSEHVTPARFRLPPHAQPQVAAVGTGV